MRLGSVFLHVCTSSSDRAKEKIEIESVVHNLVEVEEHDIVLGYVEVPNGGEVVSFISSLKKFA